MGSKARHTSTAFPAYGPVNGVLGFVIFYTFLDHTTPTIVAVLTGALGGVAASAIGFGLASALWLVLGLTVIDQLRRQVAALRGTSSDRGTWRPPFHLRTTHYALLLVSGGLVAVRAFDPALAGADAVIAAIGDLAGARFRAGDVATLAVFFIAFGIANHSLDRLVIDAIRTGLGADDSSGSR